MIWTILIQTSPTIGKSQLSKQGGSSKREISELTVFKMLDGMRMTSSGPNDTPGLPAWFPGLGVPILAKPLAHVYNLSLRSSTVPSRWKSSIITPVAKFKNPANLADYRPILVTSMINSIKEIRKACYKYFHLTSNASSSSWFHIHSECTDRGWGGEAG